VCTDVQSPKPELASPLIAKTSRRVIYQRNKQ
jgi:hypothetical protein